MLALSTLRYRLPLMWHAVTTPQARSPVLAFISREGEWT